MYTTLLINKIDIDDCSDTPGKVFFMIGEMQQTEEKLRDIIKKSGLVQDSDIVYKYNGVDMHIAVKHIPYFVKAFTDAGIAIYNIFEEYEPK